MGQKLTPRLAATALGAALLLAPKSALRAQTASLTDEEVADAYITERGNQAGI